jgi:predicted nucleic acid-binding protein
MILLLDADALIKLNRAGILGLVAEVFECIIPDEVYQEVVIKGKQSGHTDAEEIERLIESGIEVKPPAPVREVESRLDRGESAVLALASQQGSQVIISDDRQFVNFLSRSGIPHPVPAALIVVMVQQHLMTKSEAREALEQLRPSVREISYREALQELERLEES